jgi:energy-coupling factor transporter ATP-binding protein EcfA2
MQTGLPYAVVPLIGPDGAGKSTLWRAMGSVASQYEGRAIQMDGHSSSVFDIPGSRRVLQLVDFANDGAEQALLARSRPHGAVLVVSGVDSVVPGTVSSLQFAQELHITILAVALTKCDLLDDPEMLDLVTMEVRELLHKYRQRGDDIPVVPSPRIGSRPREGEEPDGRGNGAAGLLAALDRS